MKTATSLILLLICGIIHAQNTFQIGIKNQNSIVMTLFNAVQYSDTSFVVTGINNFDQSTSTFTFFGQNGNIIKTKSIETPSFPFYVMAPTKSEKHFLITYDSIVGNNRINTSVRVDIVDIDFKIEKSIILPFIFGGPTWSNYLHAISRNNELIIVTLGNEPWPENFKYTVYKIDSAGDVLLAKEYTGDARTFITSVVAEKDELMMVGQSNGRGFYHRIDKNGNTLSVKTLNFIPHYLQVDQDSHLILYGTSMDKKSTIVAKTDKNLVPKWSKKLDSEDKNYEYRGGTTTNKIIIDKMNDIFLIDGNDTGENFEGLKVMKMSSDGNLIFSRLLLDNELEFIWSVFSFMDDFVVLAFGKDRARIRKMKTDISAEDCATFEYCTTSDDFTILSNSIAIGIAQGLSPFERSPLLTKDAQLTTFHSCKPLSMPDASFKLIKDIYCIGEIIQIDTNDVSSIGFSEWTLSNTHGTKTYNGKQPIFDKLSKDGSYNLVHKLTILGCDFIDTINFSVFPQNSIFDKKDTTLCTGETLVVNLKSQLLDSILWSDGTKSDLKSIENAGKYILHAIDSSGCNLIDSIQLAYVALPYSAPQNDLIICNGESIQISIPYYPVTYYHWNDGDTTSKISVNTAGVYSVSVSNKCWEKVYDFTVILEDDCTSPFYYPNIFSPNNDGVNDIFEIIPKNAKISSFQIYDRWGSMIFENAFDLKWDGTFNNKQVATGVYVLKIIYQASNLMKEFVGTLSLVR